MTAPTQENITICLQQIEDGDRSAVDGGVYIDGNNGVIYRRWL